MSANKRLRWTAYDLQNGLFVAAKIADITSGTPGSITTVPMVDWLNGTYLYEFTPAANKSYIFNMMAYTDNTYATPNTTYAPADDGYDDPSILEKRLRWTAYDLSSGLFVASRISDITSGTPGSYSTQGMTHWVNGTYYYNHSPTAAHSYVYNMMAYTDGTFTTANTTYAPEDDDFDPVSDVVPATNDVRSGVTYGPNSSLVGTLSTGTIILGATLKGSGGGGILRKT